MALNSRVTDSRSSPQPSQPRSVGHSRPSSLGSCNTRSVSLLSLSADSLASEPSITSSVSDVVLTNPNWKPAEAHQTKFEQNGRSSSLDGRIVTPIDQDSSESSTPVNKTASKVARVVARLKEVLRGVGAKISKALSRFSNGIKSLPNRIANSIINAQYSHEIQTVTNAYNQLKNDHDYYLEIAHEDLSLDKLTNFSKHQKEQLAGLYALRTTTEDYVGFNYLQFEKDYKIVKYSFEKLPQKLKTEHQETYNNYVNLFNKIGNFRYKLDFSLSLHQSLGTFNDQGIYISSTSGDLEEVRVTTSNGSVYSVPANKLYKNLVEEFHNNFYKQQSSFSFEDQFQSFVEMYEKGIRNIPGEKEAAKKNLPQGARVAHTGWSESTRGGSR